MKFLLLCCCVSVAHALRNLRALHNGRAQTLDTSKVAGNWQECNKVANWDACWTWLRDKETPGGGQKVFETTTGNECDALITQCRNAKMLSYSVAFLTNQAKDVVHQAYFGVSGDTESKPVDFDSHPQGYLDFKLTAQTAGDSIIRVTEKMNFKDKAGAFYDNKDEEARKKILLPKDDEKPLAHDNELFGDLPKATGLCPRGLAGDKFAFQSGAYSWACSEDKIMQYIMTHDLPASCTEQAKCKVYMHTAARPCGDTVYTFMKTAGRANNHWEYEKITFVYNKVAKEAKLKTLANDPLPETDQEKAKNDDANCPLLK